MGIQKEFSAANPALGKSRVEQGRSELPRSGSLLPLNRKSGLNSLSLFHFIVETVVLD